ncbi:MAG: MFS transporter [Oscillospiraceae bacterium]
MNRLWTRDFTIITLGSVVSMLGNAIAGFAIGLLVLDFTESTFLYALFSVAYMSPKVIMPAIAGPYLDNFSRKKVIYVLDFISAAFFISFYFVLSTGFFNYTLLLLLSIFLGSVDSIYTVAYDSLYPNLVSEGNFTKAYSISSMIYPLAAVMVPVSAYLYERIGLAPLFLFNGVTFLIAAIFETRIGYVETHMKPREKKMVLKKYKEEFKSGLSYISGEKGLAVITAYFTFTAFCDAALSTLGMPYFRSNAMLGVQLFTFAMGAGVVGRFIGGMVHYKFKYPVEKKFDIAMVVYVSVSLLSAVFLFLPFPLMLVCQFVTGIMGVTSFNIRISATQSYIPDSHRARFNGVFSMFMTIGMILGQLVSGWLGGFVSTRIIVAVFMGLNLIGSFLIMARNKSSVGKIYNRAS